MVRSAVFMLALLLPLLSVSSVATADVQKDLRELLDAFLAGASIDDAAMHDRFWSENLIYTSSSGARYGKAKIMEGLDAADTSPENPPVYSAEQVEIRQASDSVAVVTFRLVATPAQGSRLYFLNTGVFELQDGQWRATTWQATRQPGS